MIGTLIRVRGTQPEADASPERMIGTGKAQSQKASGWDTDECQQQDPRNVHSSWSCEMMVNNKKTDHRGTASIGPETVEYEVWYE
jgi:hypothetical protein